MIYTRQKMEDSNLLYYLASYHKYRVDGVKNPKWDTFSGLVLDIKEAKAKGLIYFYNRVDPLIASGVVICCVPSSDPEKTSAGIRQLARMLAKNGRIDGTGCLIRVKKVTKATQGGPRSVPVHLNSIEVRDAHLIAGAEVLLMDDVTTSGSSLTACETLLGQAGAAKVRKFALASTA